MYFFFKTEPNQPSPSPSVKTSILRRKPVLERRPANGGTVRSNKRVKADVYTSPRKYLRDCSRGNRSSEERCRAIVLPRFFSSREWHTMLRANWDDILLHNAASREWRFYWIEGKERGKGWVGLYGYYRREFEKLLGIRFFLFEKEKGPWCGEGEEKITE